MKPYLSFFGLGAIITLLAGCTLSWLSPNAPWDRMLARRSDGSSYFPDTEHNWNLEVQAVNRLISNEAQHQLPPHEPTWPDFWRGNFAYLRKMQENPEKYVSFILDLRRKAELPDLPQ